MIRIQSRFTWTYTLLPYTTHFRSPKGVPRCPVQNVTYVSGRSAEIQASKKWPRVTPGVTAALRCSQVLLPRMGCESVCAWGFDSRGALYVHRTQFSRVARCRSPSRPRRWLLVVGFSTLCPRQCRYIHQRFAEV